MTWIRFLSIAAFIASTIWLIAEPGFEPALAVISSIATFISVFFIEQRKRKGSEQNQSVSNSSFGIQAGNDVNIRDIHNDNDKDA